MIKSVNIKNFQSHKNSTLEFHPGMNVIVGTSDSGKTAIIRALRWVTWNRPSGDSIRSHWGGKTEVRVVLDNGSVERSKDKVEEYIVNNNSPLRAFGMSVPQDVSETLNLTDINLQSQMDAPFLLSSTSGEVASHFNKVAGLDKIDNSQQQVESWIRGLNGMVASHTKTIERLTAELEKYEKLEKIEIELEVLEEEKKRYDIKLLKKNKFVALIRDIKETEESIEEMSLDLTLENDVNSLLAKMNEARLRKSGITMLSALLKEINEQTEEIEDKEHILFLEDEVAKLLQLQKDYIIAKSKVDVLKNAVIYINNTKMHLEELEAELTQMSASFTEAFPDVCPLCGTVIKK